MKGEAKRLDDALALAQKYRDDIAKLTSELIQFPTENPPVKDHQIQKFIRDELAKSGIAAQIHETGTEAAALCATIPGNNASPTSSLILYSHADVVPAGDLSKWKYPPYSGRMADGRIYGRGASDMKAGLASQIFALRILHELELETPENLQFVSVLDEENWHTTPLGWNTSDWLLETGKLSGSACIMGEPCGVDKICIGERGDFWIKVSCAQRPMHGSMPVYEQNAFVKLSRFLDEVQDQVEEIKPKQPGQISKVVTKSVDFVSRDLQRMHVRSARKQARAMLTGYSMNIGVLHGGTMINSVPEYCEALVAISVPLGGEREQVHSRIKRIVAKRDYRDSIKIDLLGESQSDPSFTNPNSPVVQTLSSAIFEQTKEYPKLMVTQGTSDGNVYRRRGIDTCFYGPGTFENIHGYDESVSVEDTVTVVKCYLAAAANYSSTPKYR